jgi:hypothetical protein
MQGTRLATLDPPKQQRLFFTETKPPEPFSTIWVMATAIAMITVDEIALQFTSNGTVGSQKFKKHQESYPRQLVHVLICQCFGEIPNFVTYKMNVLDDATLLYASSGFCVIKAYSDGKRFSIRHIHNQN